LGNGGSGSQEGWTWFPSLRGLFGGPGRVNVFGVLTRKGTTLRIYRDQMLLDTFNWGLVSRFKGTEKNSRC